MNILATAKGPVLRIKGLELTESQILAAVNCAMFLEHAYQQGEEEGGSVEWFRVDAAREHAHDVMPALEQAALDLRERQQNVPRHPEFVLLNDITKGIPAADFEFKRPDDTEGGTPD